MQTIGITWLEWTRSQRILTGLAALQEKGILCDVELQVEGRKLSAHRAVLSAGSSYFSAMFSGAFKEKEDNVIVMKDVSFAGLEAVVKCIYTTKLDITADNVEEILPTAHLLQLQDIVDECSRWMVEKITPENSISFLKVAEKYDMEVLSMDILSARINEFIPANFSAVSQTEQFRNISEQALCKYLSSDTLRTDHNEIDVYNAAKKWIQSQVVYDAQTVRNVMENIRFGLIQNSTLFTEVLSDDIIGKNEHCRGMVIEALKYHGNGYSQPLYEGNLNKPRGKLGVLLIQGGLRLEGYNIFGLEQALNILSFPDFKCKGLGTVSVSTVYQSMCTVQVNNFLFLFGTDCRGYQNFTKRFDATNNAWLELKGVHRQATIGSRAARFGDNILLIGGMFVTRESTWVPDGKKFTDDVRMYSIPTNEWLPCPPLPRKLIDFGACTLNGFVYVTGGYTTTGGASDEVFAYDSHAKLWLVKKSMNVPKHDHTADTIGGRLYVIGGDFDRGNLDIAEMYDPIVEQWTIIAEGIPVTHACSVVLKDKIYLLGGLDLAGCRQIVEFNTKTNTMKKLEETLPVECIAHVAALLTFPTLL